MAWVVEGLDIEFIVGSPGFAESSGKTSQTVLYYVSIFTTMCFWSAWEGEMMNVIEMFTNKCVEVWKNLRLNPYSDQGLLSVSEMGVQAWWGRGHGGMLVGWSFLGP